MLSDQQVGITAADQRQVQQCIGIFTHLVRTPGKKNDRNITSAFYELNAFIQIIGDDQASANKKIIHPGADRKF